MPAVVWKCRKCGVETGGPSSPCDIDDVLPQPYDPAAGRFLTEAELKARPAVPPPPPPPSPAGPPIPPGLRREIDRLLKEVERLIGRPLSLPSPPFPGLAARLRVAAGWGVAAGWLGVILAVILLANLLHRRSRPVSSPPASATAAPAVPSPPVHRMTLSPLSHFAYQGAWADVRHTLDAEGPPANPVMLRKAEQHLHRWASSLPRRGDPGTARLQSRIGRDDLRHNAFRHAAVHLSRAAGDSPRDPSLFTDLAAAYDGLGDSAAARRALTVALSLNPRRSSSWMLLGRILAEGGDATRAEASLLLAYRHSANRVVTFNDLRSEAADTALPQSLRNAALGALEEIESR